MIFRQSDLISGLSVYPLKVRSMLWIWQLLFL